MVVRLCLSLPVLVGIFGMTATPLRAQVEAEPVLRGQVLVGESPMDSGTVVLHRITAQTQGELDSLSVGPDGAFSFDLPSVPDPGGSDMYFASTRHQGVLYFGGALTTAVQLDSLYRIQAWDTLVVSEPEGRELPVLIRNVFLEPEGEDWLATDLIQLQNDLDRTLVSLGEGAVWRYPLPEEATSPSMGGDFIPGSSEFVNGELVVHSALPPGERVFVIRYRVPDPFITIPVPGETQALEVLVREPAPPIEIPGLETGLQVELEPGSTYRRFSGSELTDVTVEIQEGEEEGSFPVEWLAVLLALLLTGVALWAVTGRPQRSLSPEAAEGAGPRKALILEIARLDRDFESRENPGPEEEARYRRTRKTLMDRLAGLG